MFMIACALTMLTVDFWTPIHYAQAFDLPERIPER